MINSSARAAAPSADAVEAAGAAHADGAELGPRPSRPALSHLSSARAGVLRAVIATGGPVTVAALAEQLSQHPNTVREHLDALVTDGRIERFRRAPAGRGRPAWLYQPVSANACSAGDSTLMSGPLGNDGQEYVALAVALIDQVSADIADPRAMARAAGERWGRTLAEHHLGDTAGSPASPTDEVVDMLRELRFEPTRAADAENLRLTTCPFLDTARRHPEVVCQIHLGIVRGALEQLGANPDESELRPFAEPGACLLNFADHT